MLYWSAAGVNCSIQFHVKHLRYLEVIADAAHPYSSADFLLQATIYALNTGKMVTDIYNKIYNFSFS